MSIRAEDRPKAFEAQFFSSSKKLSKYGDFDFKPGEIVRKRSSHWNLRLQPTNEYLELVCSQGKFKMRLKAQRMIDDGPVCQTEQDEREGTIRVKPTTFNDAVNVKASLLCPTCECEKVCAQIVIDGQEMLKRECFNNHNISFTDSCPKCCQVSWPRWPCMWEVSVPRWLVRSTHWSFYLSYNGNIFNTRFKKCFSLLQAKYIL